MTAPLYAIVDELEELGELISQAGGLTPEIEERFAEWQAEFGEKVERVALYIQHLTRMAQAAEQEEHRLRDLKGSRLSAAAGLKEYLMRELERAGYRKVERDTVKVRIQKNSRPAIRWTEKNENLPGEFARIVVSPDTQKAYEAWKAGESLPEGFEVEEGQHLRIQ